MNERNSPRPSVFQSHPRCFERNRYVYPVVSRRAGGVSIGVNLNVDKLCNFACVYCQVDRTEPATAEPIDPDRLATELETTVAMVTDGRLFELPNFAATPSGCRHPRDIAISGNGEPTLSPAFPEAVRVCVEARRRLCGEDVKIVLITNASRFDRPSVGEALETLNANGGEIWAKLDAGTEAAYRRIARSNVPFERILENITTAACRWPIVIQSLWMRHDGRMPNEIEQQAFCDRLSAMSTRGGRIRLVQLYTVARRPAEATVEPLLAEELEALAARVGEEVGVTTAVYA